LNGNGSRGAKRGRERSARRRDGSDFRHSNGFAVSGSHRQASVVNDLAALAGLFCESGFSVGRLIDTRKLAIMPTPTRATASRLKPKLSPRGGWPRARGISLGDSCPLLDFSERWRSEQRKPQPIVGAYEAALLELGLTRTSPGAETLAQSIIAIATQGERDPNRLRERAIERVWGLPEAPCSTQSGNSPVRAHKGSPAEAGLVGHRKLSWRE